VGWFDPVYRAAKGRAERVPWALLGPHPYLIDWLDRPVMEPPGRRAVVVGCGLGDDAAELVRRGFEVTAFDVSATAVAWAERRFRDLQVDWRVLDLLSLPDDLVGAADLVVDVRTVTSLPGVVRDAAMHAIGSIASPGAIVVTVTLMAVDAEVARTTAGPPWPQAPSELAAYRAAVASRTHPSIEI
jgi:SAM-dependent methyltransferase